MIQILALIFIGVALLVWMSYQARSHQQQVKRILINRRANQQLALNQKYDFEVYSNEFKEITGCTEAEMREK